MGRSSGSNTGQRLSKNAVRWGSDASELDSRHTGQGRGRSGAGQGRAGQGRAGQVKEDLEFIASVTFADMLQS